MSKFRVKNLRSKKKGQKPSVFIGSSTESLPVAKAIKKMLGAKLYEVDIWDEDIFDPSIQQGKSEYGIDGKIFDKGKELQQQDNKDTELIGAKAPTNLDSLRHFSDIYDFAIFVFVPDDKLVSQTRKHIKSGEILEGYGTRHNLVFEFGLFLGRIGPKKTFVLADDSISHFINNFFTDLKDVSLYQYKSQYMKWLNEGRPEETMPFDEHSLKEQVEAIKNEISKTKMSIDLGFLPSTALAIGYYENLLKWVIININTSLSSNDSKDKLKVVLIENGEKKYIDIELKRRQVKYKIVIPRALMGASHDEYKKEIAKQGMLDLIVPSGSRPFTLFCHPCILQEGGDLIIYDIPSTLFSSSKAIDMLTNVKDIRQLLDEKEKRNFRKAVEYLIANRAPDLLTANIEQIVELVQIDEVGMDFER